MKAKKISPEQLVKLGNANKNEGLSLKQFENLLNGVLKFKISNEEVKEIFTLIDVSHDGALALEEIASLVKK